MLAYPWIQIHHPQFAIAFEQLCDDIGPLTRLCASLLPDWDRRKRRIRLDQVWLARFLEEFQGELCPEELLLAQLASCQRQILDDCLDILECVADTHNYDYPVALAQMALLAWPDYARINALIISNEKHV